jgi:hypothetical protein
MLNMWLCWSAFLAILFFALGGSLVWALSYFPVSEAVAISAIILFAAVCLVQGVALFFNDDGINRNDQQNEPESAPDEQTTGNNKQRSDAANLVALINSQRDEIRSYRNETARNERRKELRESLTVVLLALAFGATVAQAIIARRQLDSFENESHIRLRAYISVLQDAVYFVRKTNPSPIVTYVNLFNNGQTVALKSKIFAGIKVHELPEPKTFAALGDEMKEPAPISLPSGGIRIPIQRTGTALSPEQFDLIWANKARIYVFGHISYFDVFDIHHAIVFCRYYSGTQVVPDDPRGVYPGSDATACENPDFNSEY